MESHSPFAAITELGALQSQHPLARYTRITLWVLGIFYLLGCGLLPIVAYSVMVELYRDSGNLAGSLALPLFCVGAWLAPGLALIRQVWWNGIFALAVYERGLALHTRKGVTAFPWDSIVNFCERRSLRGGGFIGYSVRTQDGQTFRINYNFENFDRFCQAAVPRIQAAIARHRLSE